MKKMAKKTYAIKYKRNGVMKKMAMAGVAKRKQRPGENMVASKKKNEENRRGGMAITKKITIGIVMAKNEEENGEGNSKRQQQ